jgi:glyoxylase-like metal-dependent hydrolase (beta-lactamase superfamily II)
VIDLKSLLPTAKHFRYVRLAPGVYAAIDPLLGGGSGGCNAGIVDLGDRTLVFDSGVTPRAGRELRTAAATLTRRVPSYLVVSHYHNDHIRGSQVFTGAVEIGTTLTRELVATKGRTELKEDWKDAASQAAEMKSLARSKDEREREFGAFFLPYWRGILASLPEVRLRLPDMTFDNRLTFQGSKRVAQLIAFGNGHCESDCVLFLPQERILFCGDLLFVKCHPYLGHGDPVKLLSILNQLRGMRARVFVPGHGPLGQKKHVDELQSYIRTLSAQARRVLRKGGTEEDAASLPVPDSYEDWILARLFYAFNMRYVFRQLAQNNRRQT